MVKDYFVCNKCGKKVDFEAIGTKNRNHCPFCLWSLHVDKKTPGDRYDTCRGMMRPTGLTFKDEGVDKYGKKRQGEIMAVHECTVCGKISINRLAGDDESKKVLEVLKNTIVGERSSIKYSNIELLTEKDRKEVERQLFGGK